MQPELSQIFDWTYNFYKEALNIKNFSLKENDYTIKNNKIAGNAQYIKKTRWLHHSSFLWDFLDENMEDLKIPKVAPKYRENRDHKDFLCKLKNCFSYKELFVKKIKDHLTKNLETKNINLKELEKELRRKGFKYRPLILYQEGTFPKKS